MDPNWLPPHPGFISPKTEKLLGFLIGWRLGFWPWSARFFGAMRPSWRQGGVLVERGPSNHGICRWNLPLLVFDMVLSFFLALSLSLSRSLSVICLFLFLSLSLSLLENRLKCATMANMICKTPQSLKSIGESGSQVVSPWHMSR